MSSFDTHGFGLANKRRLFWAFQILGWGFFPLMSCVLLRSQASAFLPVILFLGVLGFSMTSFFLRPVLRWFRRRKTPSMWVSLPLLFLASLGLGAVDSVIINHGLFDWVGSSASPETRKLYQESSGLLRTSVYVLWIALYYGLNYFIQTRDNHLRMIMLESETRDSELRLLRAQVNPHFLFNALNSIIAEAEQPSRVIEITQMVADYLRFSISQKGDLHPFGAELDALESYLRLEKIRYEERFEYTLEVSHGVRLQQVPYALMQPLLENAVKYGMQTSPRPLRVSLRARLDGGLLVLEVENSGHWVVDGGSVSTGIGLGNLRRRLELLYGNLASIESVVHPASVLLRVVLPLLPRTPLHTTP
jgi:hypothetical protein